MGAFRHILFATDLDGSSAGALQVALDMASSMNAALSVVHVCELGGYAAAAMCEAGGDLASPLVEEAQRALERLVARADRDGVHPRALVKLGAPWQEIVAAAEEERADLIVMGTHGRRGLAHALLGSVAEKVVQTSPVPVLTVRQADPAAAALKLV
ncbi:universal stress protein [Anaeromyxobacter diazotrophicus]|uniref:Universal stress protein n=1 Tax=Anaeromyxobacter diazotrophicus TaxID=2590199 RepID=A0A7I9VNZ2_9BACT|nr:universal stress protein [Anaeromyxobacter diazotrophicus]GEJ58123.1 universal stress protein UspA [Anaeromyxobacter diazotrophicus]